MALPKLTPKQARFVHEYLVDLNATQAVLRAGYKMTEKAAASQGNRLLRNVEIQRGIQEQREAREKSSMITAEWVRRQIAEIAQDEEAKDQDRLKALDMLAKMLGLYERREDEDANAVKVVIEDEAEEWAV